MVASVTEIVKLALLKQSQFPTTAPYKTNPLRSDALKRALAQE